MLLQSILTLLLTVALVALAFFKNIKFPQLNDQTLSSRSYDASKNVSTRAMYKPGFSVAVPERCPNLGKSMDLMILVASERNHFQERMAIRQTWGNVSQQTNVGIVFFIGASWDGQSDEKLEEEKKLYGDIVQGNSSDTNMYNSTLKGVSMLEWVQSYCSNVTFLLRCDDRTFVNLPNLLSWIDQHKNDQYESIHCHMKYYSFPNRTKGSDAYVSEDEYEPDMYPDHCGYGIYLMPAKVVQILYATALNERYFRIHDVFMTGIVANKLGLPRVSENQFKHHYMAYDDECGVKSVIALLEIYYENQMKYWLASQNNSTRCGLDDLPLF